MKHNFVATKEHYESKINNFISHFERSGWLNEKGIKCVGSIPDESCVHRYKNKIIPSWKLIALMILRNDHTFKLANFDNTFFLDKIKKSSKERIKRKKIEIMRKHGRY